jgi:hypothetical protein
VADFVAGVGGVGVGGVGAPGLVELDEVGFDVGAAGAEEGAEDLSFLESDDGVDGAEAFGPGSAEDLHKDGFGLVVEGMGGEDGVGVAGGEEGGEEVVAEIAGGLFDRFASVGDALRDAGLMEMERDVVGDTKIFYEALVGVRLFATEAVVDVDGREADAEGFSCGVEGEDESDGVCSAGDGYAEAVAGLDLCLREGDACSG